MGTVYTSAKKTKFLFYSTAIGAAMNVILSIILIQFLDVFGAIIATALSYFIIWLLRIIDSRKIMKMLQNGNKLQDFVLLCFFSKRIKKNQFFRKSKYTTNKNIFFGCIFYSFVT